VDATRAMLLSLSAAEVEERLVELALDARRFRRASSLATLIRMLFRGGRLLASSSAEEGEREAVLDRVWRAGLSSASGSDPVDDALSTEGDRRGCCCFLGGRGFSFDVDSSSLRVWTCRFRFGRDIKRASLRSGMMVEKRPCSS
jgi:hypothetical protein